MKKSLSILVVLICFTTNIHSEVKIGIIGKGSDYICGLIKQLNNTKDEQGLNLVGFSPSFNYENTENAGITLTHNVKNVIEASGINYVQTTQELIEQVDFVILESYKGLLDFNAAFQVIKAKKNLYMEQPENFELSDMILLYALSKKYLVSLNVYTVSDIYIQLAQHFNYSFKKVSTFFQDNNKLAIIAGTSNGIVIKDLKNDGVYFYNGNNFEQIQSVETIKTDLYKDLLNILQGKNSRPTEEESLNLASMIFSIHKSGELNGKDVLIEKEYMEAFNIAFNKMKIYN